MLTLQCEWPLGRPSLLATLDEVITGASAPNGAGKRARVLAVRSCLLRRRRCAVLSCTLASAWQTFKKKEIIIKRKFSTTHSYHVKPAEVLSGLHSPTLPLPASRLGPAPSSGDQRQ